MIKQKQNMTTAEVADRLEKDGLKLDFKTWRPEDIPKVDDSKEWIRETIDWNLSEFTNKILDKMNEAASEMLEEIKAKFIDQLRQTLPTEEQAERVGKGLAVLIAREDPHFMERIALKAKMPFANGLAFGGIPDYVKTDNGYTFVYPDELFCVKCGHRHLPSDPCAKGDE